MNTGDSVNTGDFVNTGDSVKHGGLGTCEHRGLCEQGLWGDSVNTGKEHVETRGDSVNPGDS